MRKRDGIEKDSIQGKRSRGKHPIHYIDQIKILTQMSKASGIQGIEFWRNVSNKYYITA